MKKVFAKIGLFIDNIVRSLDNVQGSGYSGRKLSALFGLLYAAYLSDDLKEDNRLYAVMAFLAVSLLCLGIVTVEQIIRFKAGTTEKKPDEQTG